MGFELHISVFLLLLPFKVSSDSIVPLESHFLLTASEIYSRKSVILKGSSRKLCLFLKFAFKIFFFSSISYPYSVLVMENLLESQS